MNRNDLSDLAAFAVVAEEGSFTRAAARLGMSQSALSHAMKALEDRLGLRLLARTTRSVSTTEAGQRLLRTLRPALDDIAAGLAAVGELREKPAGTIRITTGKHAAVRLMWPALSRFLADFPEVQVELSIDSSLTDIVASRFDAGVRLGEQVEKDMIAVRIGPDIRAAIVGAPSYFARRPVPCAPQDLAGHDCINYRFTASGAVYVWEFEEKGQPINVRVSGSLVSNDMDVILAAALDGRGLAYVFEDEVAEHIAAGRLVRVLDDWCKPFPGYYLYYPSRRQIPPALAALVDALRYRL
ncbi:LysR family transcriptional regulator [Azospirillum isscasi]|uniref:LysR family transcriptional regulator n=1 Tax=Azospirillum isscasi TaxID=3053926 RepID=A0ABU0WN10_9PROT|nr:LysR family transcriptional regulator [Azospirillum isscasi]MDQ2105497.1 LysR family transcriptional regulator [Azospirillum isscasi]